jgi:para-nitrobenzyl esterase
MTQFRMFRFSYVPEIQRGKVPGATHGAEIAFAFNAVAAAMGPKASPADLAMAATMSDYWAAFIKNGDPNGAGRPHWSSYDPKTEDVADFSNDGVRIGADPFKARLDLWKADWDRGG